jgi:hypothetical protein
LEKLLRVLATPDKDERGNFILREPVREDDRESLMERLRVLKPWMESGPKKRIGDALVRLFEFYGKQASGQEAANLIKAFTRELSVLPGWAVERACLKFISGTVTPEDLDQKTIDRSFPATGPQISILARKIAAPWIAEAARIYKTLNGTFEVRETPEERERTKAHIESVMAGIKARQEAAEDAEEVIRAQKYAEKVIPRNLRYLENEYRNAGLDVPAVPPGGVQVSLALRLANGWKIQTRHGRKVLVSPLGVELNDHENRRAGATTPRDEGAVYPGEFGEEDAGGCGDADDGAPDARFGEA